jgi:hypothetical protein
MLSRDSAFPQLLAELKRAHSDLLLAIGELDGIIHGPPPPEKVLMDARVKVSRASLARRLLWGRVLARLAPLVGGRKKADLRLIQEADIRLVKTAVNHIAAWRPATAIAHWKSYSAVESDLLQRIVGVVALEQKLVYPLLERPELKAA